MKRAIVIDDSRAMRSILSRNLEQLGFSVAQAGNGKEALATLEGQASPALALVDWNMPEMSGIDFVTAIRQQHDFDGMRIVMVTTESEKANVDRALQAGADEYVMKPFTPEVLRGKLAALGFADLSAPTSLT
jgi:two-component system, chemotaxis family, chemotaxis protein CheY